MFDILSDKLQSVLSDVRSRGKLSEDDVNRAMREIRLALLEADVNFKVVRSFTAAGAPNGEFLAYGAAFRGGVTLAAADVDGDGSVEIVTGAGTGGGPHVEAFTATGGVRRSFLAFDPAFLGGVFVG